MSDQPKPTGEWTALAFFRIVHGKGDAGSEFAFHAQNPELKKGWVRLAAHTSLELAKQLAAERERRKAAETEWWAMVQRQRQQLAAAQATIAETSDILSLQFNAGKGRTLEEVSSRNQRAIVRLRQTDTTALTDEREESELEIEKYRLLLKKIEPFAKAWAMEEICDEIEDLIKTRPPKNP